MDETENLKRLLRLNRWAVVLNNDLQAKRSVEHVHQICLQAMVVISFSGDDFDGPKFEEEFNDGAFVGFSWRDRPAGHVGFCGLPGDVHGLGSFVADFVIAIHRIAVTDPHDGQCAVFCKQLAEPLSNYLQVVKPSMRHPPDIGLKDGKPKELLDTLFAFASWEGNTGTVSMDRLLRAMYPGVREDKARTRLRSVKRSLMRVAEIEFPDLYVDLGKEKATIKIQPISKV